MFQTFQSLNYQQEMAEPEVSFSALDSLLGVGGGGGAVLGIYLLLKRVGVIKDGDNRGKMEEKLDTLIEETRNSVEQSTQMLAVLHEQNTKLAILVDRGKRE